MRKPTGLKRSVVVNFGSLWKAPRRMSRPGGAARRTTEVDSAKVEGGGPGEISEGDGEGELGSKEVDRAAESEAIRRGTLG